jgi:Domain of unknown function (DUF932)
MIDMEQTRSLSVNGRKEGIPATDLPFDEREERWDRTWYDKYGILTKNLLVHSKNGETYDDRRFKGVFIDDKYTNLVSRFRIMYPNEEVDNLLIVFAEKLNLEIKKRYWSHYGDAQYWELLSEDLDEQIEYKGKNDVVKIGCIVRNSLSTNVALGADAYTWRVFCENGAIARGKDFGFALKHVGKDPEKLTEAFISGLDKILADSQGLIEYYRKAASLRMNKKIANHIAKRIPIKAFPDCMSYDYKTHTPILGREDDLWKAFNDVTEKVWHPERFNHKETGFLNRAGIEITMHAILKNAINGKYADE